jgi:CRISPR-associated protein Cas1
MPTAVVEQPDTRIRLRSERLIVYGRDPASGEVGPLQALPLAGVERLVINERVQISTQALAALLQHGASLVLTGLHGRLFGLCLPGPRANGATRLAQYRRTDDPAFALALSRAIVLAKIRNQRRVVQRLALTRGTEINPALVALDRLRQLAAGVTTLDRLRGAEGAASARYFATWAEFLPEEFPFDRRSVRPPLNAVNACISFGSALVYAELTARLHAHGLDPALGLLHVPDDGRWSLALDLMEPYRPCLVEALALHLLSHRILRAEHFSPERGGVYLNPEGRKAYLLHYERRITQEIYSEHRGHRTTLRREFDRAALELKAALTNPVEFTPFVMN